MSTEEIQTINRPSKIPVTRVRYTTKSKSYPDATHAKEKARRLKQIEKGIIKVTI